MISLVVAGDRVLVRQSLTRLLSARSGIRVAGDAPVGAHLISLLSRTSPDVLLLDASATATATTGSVRRIREQSDTRILVVGEFPVAVCRSAMVRAGATAYLGPDCGETELVAEIERITSAESGRRAPVETGRGAAEGLSSREFDVLCLMGSGLNGRAVAAALGLSPKTVSTYRSRILAKLDLGGTAEIVRYAVEHGFQAEP
jgi:DNA-binding NarL/FixJ family response regulator